MTDSARQKPKKLSKVQGEDVKRNDICESCARGRKKEGAESSAFLRILQCGDMREPKLKRKKRRQNV